MLRDCDIRNEICKLIELQNKAQSYRLINELSICDGLARADIAVANGKFYGYEIKSDADSLNRLENQISCYNRTFDYLVLVVGEKHQNAAPMITPAHWGITIAKAKKDGSIRLKEIRRPKLNKNIDVLALLDLLWKSEVEEILEHYDIKGISGKNRRVLRKTAAEKIPAAIIQDYTRETLKNRVGWRSSQICLTTSVI